MAEESVRRFCPHCAVIAEGSPYTMWTPCNGGMVCENDVGPHRVDMYKKRYNYNIWMTKSLYGGGKQFSIKRAIFTDDGIICDGQYYYKEMFEVTINAMEAEAEAGIFEVGEWKPSFPRRSMELLAKMKGRVERGLEDGDLPHPLISIVIGYLW